VARWRHRLSLCVSNVPWWLTQPWVLNKMSMMTTVRVGPDSVGWRQWGGVTGYSYIRRPHVFFWTGAPLGVNPALIRVSYDQKSKGLFLLEHHVGLGLHVYAHRSPCHRLMALNVATRVDAGESCRCQGDGRVAWLEVRLRHFCYSDSGLSHSTLARLPVITVNSACRRRCLATTPRRCYAANVRHHRRNSTPCRQGVRKTASFVSATVMHATCAHWWTRYYFQNAVFWK